jgi:hypothetical protein
MKSARALRVLQDYKSLDFNRSCARDNKWDCIKAFREYIFPEDDMSPEEIATLMVSPRGEELEKRVARAELVESLNNLVIAKFEAGIGGIEGSLIELADNAIECTRRAQASNIIDAIENATEINFKVSGMLGIDGQRVCQVRRLSDNVYQLIAVVDSLIAGTRAPLPPATYEEKLEWVREQCEEYDDWQHIYMVA